MSAITQRSRRATAGKRMANLVGKAVEDDESFWNHDTWADNGEEDDGNDSFRESDEDSDVRKDHFDSDFDDSESDHEAEDVAAGQDEEKRLRQEEKASRRTAMDGVARAGRELLQKKRGRIKGNRIFGDGMNAGLVLNFPPNFGQKGFTTTKPAATMIAGSSRIQIPPVISAAAIKLEPPPSPSVAAVAESTAVKQPATVRSAPVIRAAAIPATKVTRVTLASTRSRRGKTQLRTSTQESTKASTAHVKGSKATRSTAAAATTAAATKRSKRRMFSQEELLLEAATITEPENGRWLLGRKRLYQQAEAARNAQNQKQGSSKLLQRYVSKRGCFNTLNFSEMDVVPKILVPNTSATTKPKPVQPTMCVITGQRARYKDPKTQLGCYDLAAFRELQRRHLAGEPLKTPTLAAPTIKIRAADAAALPPTKKAKIQKQQPPKVAVAAKPIEVPSLQPEATPPVVVPATPTTVAATVASPPIIDTPAVTTIATTTPTSTRAQRTVLDPDRKLTMRTRNASKHASPENAKPTSNAADVAVTSQLIPPVSTLTSAAAALPTTTVIIKPNNKRGAAPAASKDNSKKARTTKAAAPSPTAAPPDPAVPPPAAPVSIPAPTTASTPATTVPKGVKASPVATSKTSEDHKPASGDPSTRGKKTIAPAATSTATTTTTLSAVAKIAANQARGKKTAAPAATTTATVAMTTTTATTLSAVAKKAADQAAGSSVTLPVVAKCLAATMSTSKKRAAPKKPPARKASKASQAKKQLTTAAAPAAIPANAAAAATEESATLPLPKIKKRKSSLRMSPNTLVHTALAAYVKQQNEEPSK